MTQTAADPHEGATGERVRAADDLWQVLLAVEQGRQRTARQHGINTTHLSTLSHLDAHNGVGQVELANYLYLNPSSIVSLIDRLEAKGLVARTPHPEDRRRTILCITEQGRLISLQLRDTFDAAVHTLSDDQILAVADALQHVAARLGISTPVAGRPASVE